MKKYFIYLIFFFLITAINANSQRIYVSGDPTFPSAAFDLTEAGNNFENSVTSSSGTYITITHQNGWYRLFGNFNWRVTIHKSDIIWNPSLELEARRSGNGSSGSLFNNWISGGTNFQTVTNIPSNFFEGGAVRNDVPVEYRINNISVLIPADDFETTIYYTVYEN